MKLQRVSTGDRCRTRVLAEGDGRLYFTDSTPWGSKSWPVPRVAYVALDDQGRPIGVKDIPQPPWVDSCEVICGRYLDGKLYVGTRGMGFQVFDPKTETWTSYGPAQGLPSRDVDEFFPIGGRMLYCNSGRTHCTLNLADGAVTLVHRRNPQKFDKDWSVSPNLLLAWGNGPRVVAVDSLGVWDDLLSDSPRRTPLPVPDYCGWDDRRWPRVFQAAESAGRRFGIGTGGLYEFDAAGKVKSLRAWQLDESWWTTAGLQIGAPGDCPLVWHPCAICAVGCRVVIDNGHLIIYDVATDTWYGPIALFIGGPLMPASHGIVWGGLTCFALDDAIAYARSTGRVMTTADYRRRLQQYIDAAKPLDRAKLALATRQFDKAKSAFQEILDADPNHGEALILMGFLHDRNCLNQPDEAIKYYRRAAALENNPVASCSGMCFWGRVLRDRGQWQETLDLCKEILRRYPRWDLADRQYIWLLQGVSQEELRRKNAKQPAPAASNKVERPAR